MEMNFWSQVHDPQYNFHDASPKPGMLLKVSSATLSAHAQGTLSNK